MKFSEMPYERPDMSALKEQFAALTERLQNAPDYAAARAAFLEEQVLNKHVDTLFTLASVRHTIDTRDKFYDEEMEFANSAMPQIQQWQDSWTAAMLASPYRKNLAEEYGDLMFVNAEIERKAFSPDIMEELQQENELTQQYGKLLASAQIPFEGGVYTLSQLSPFKNDPDDARRLAAWKAEGQWYKDNQKQLDDIYDKLTHLRDKMGKKLGYEGYTTLGYYRMGRNCYTKADVEKFRAAVVKYLVPLADSIYREQAKRLGKQYPMSFADNALMFRSGNPAPCGDADAILAQGKKFYEELSPETGIFFNTMLDNELLDVLSTPGKAAGGCGIIRYRSFLPTSTAPSMTLRWSRMKRVMPLPHTPTVTACRIPLCGPAWKGAKSTPCRWNSLPGRGRRASLARIPASSCTAIWPAP